MRITRSIGWTKILPSPTSPVRAEERMALMHGSTNGSEHTISIFTFSWNSMTTVVPRYWLTISCSPPWPLTRLSVIPVTPAWNSAALTSGRRSGRTMVVMSFMVENLAPVARGVNGIVHQMHGSDVTLQIISHSILYAAISIMQDVQQCCITQSVGLAVSGGRRRAVAPLNPLHARSTDRARGHLRLAGVLASSGMELALPPAVTRKGGLHAHRANRRAARRVLLRGVRGAGAVPAAPRWLLDRIRAGLWLGEHQVRSVRRQLRRGWCHRVREARRHAQPQRPYRRGDQRLGTFGWDGQHRVDVECHRISVSLPPSQERLLHHGWPRLLQLLREFHPLLRRDRVGVHGRRGLRHPGRSGRVAHPGRELRVRRRGRRERERRGKVRHRLAPARHRF